MQLVEGECVTAGIAERLQRTRRPPKRPYSLPDIPKPKPKKQASKSTHHKLQSKHADRLLRQDSGSTSSEQFAQPRQHHTQYSQYQQQQQQHQRKASLRWHASSNAAVVAKKANRGRWKGRRVVEDVGCIRAAAYQGGAFMQARMDVLEQQGVVQGNQAPADHDAGQQVSTPAVVPAFITQFMSAKQSFISNFVLFCLFYCTAGDVLMPGANTPFRLTPVALGYLFWAYLNRQRFALIVDAAALSTKQVGKPVDNGSCSCPEDTPWPALP